ncbi:serine hydrolase domain-containing protein [Streptomyces sp. NPDC007856]|uniref:serine hydrolase domain-containing protein n=1 Tax=Streptomyces sp. NPDC007856 TaxID=3364781 RepID=UPI00367B4AAA
MNGTSEPLDAVLDPGIAAAVPERLAKTRQFLEKDFAEGLHHGFQLYASVHGSPVADFAYGRVLGNKVTANSLLHWLCATKPLTSVAIALLVDDGAIALSDPVTRHVPEFGAAGKEGARIGDLLSHTVPYRDGSSQFVPSLDWRENLRAACLAEIDDSVGVGAVRTYSTWINAQVLAEIIARTSGQDYRDFLRTRVLDPLGMARTFVGMTPDEYSLVESDLVAMTYGGTRKAGSSTSHDGFVAGDPRLRAACIPGIGGMGPMRDLAKLYEALLGCGDVPDRAVWARVSDILRQQHPIPEPSEDWDNWASGWSINSMTWSRGFVTDRDMYCPQASRQVFGQPGERTVMALADPAIGLVLTFSFNSYVSSAVAGFRLNLLCQAVYEDTADLGGGGSR